MVKFLRWKKNWNNGYICDIPKLKKNKTIVKFLRYLKKKDWNSGSICE